MVPQLRHDEFSQQEWLREQLAQQSTVPLSSLSTSLSASAPPTESAIDTSLTAKDRKKYIVRVVALLLLGLLGVLLYFIWQPAHIDTQSAAKQGFVPASTSSSTVVQAGTTTGGTIQVYVVGAVKRPGIYTLPADARVYQLLQAAGGPAPDANLVALNLAARLHDGQEIYVAVVGEKVPNTGGSANSGSNQTNLVNINTATAAELVQQLHLSSTTANTIVNYRTQHGPYESVEQLATVISKATYDKIKDMVTV